MINLLTNQNKQKLVLLLQDTNHIIENEQEILAQVHLQIRYDGNIYIPVHQNEQVTLCRIDTIDNQEFITDGLSDEEFLQVQKLYLEMMAAGNV